MLGHKFPYSKNVPWIGAYYTKQLKNILSGLHPIIGNKISIRVNGIDTPDIRGKCEKEKYDAQQAKEMVADILKDAEQITLKNMERGKYFRIAADVIEELTNLFILHGRPEHIRSDNGPEFTSKAIRKWLDNLKVGPLFIEPGSPWEIGYSLRHTYATFQIFNGVDYHTLSKNLGTSIGMLEKHYSHLTPTLGANKLAGKRFPDLSE